MQRARRFLGGLSAESFLEHYWQKRPLLVRGAAPDYVSPVQPEELAGLACEEEIESRVVVFDGQTWQLENGPFRSDTFKTRGQRDWTLLVQDLDEHLPEVGSLLTALDFLPGWRIDDVMASFAAVGGSVGPHYDEYDVFLLQVQGVRRWQISTDYSRDDLRADSELRLLRSFKPQNEWLLHPGDMLYLPPHVAHFGVAETACMTFSLGCRAPSLTDLVAQFAGLVLSECSELERYRDRDLRLDEAKAGISDHACERATALIKQALSVTPDAVGRSLAAVATTPKALFRNDGFELDPAEVNDTWTSPTGLWRRKGSRWTWYLGEKTYAYVDGREYTLESPTSPEGFLRELCSCRHFERPWLEQLPPSQAKLVRELIRDGQLTDSE